ncbi:MAG: hypothetical protein HY347_01665 [candidate division NC10 bacterium]|nr:hypothetical protein [candidate division NC10 bacterium]
MIRSMRDIGAKVDELGKLREELKTLAERERGLVEEVKSFLKAWRLEEVAGGSYSARLIRAELLTVDPERYYELVPFPIFLKSVRVIMEKAQEHLGEGELQELAASTEVREALKVTRLEGHGLPAGGAKGPFHGKGRGR